MNNINEIIKYIIKDGFVPYSDSKVNDSDVFYLKILTHHYNLLEPEIKYVCDIRKINTAIEFGSYLAVGSMLCKSLSINHVYASDIYKLDIDSNYVCWLNKNDIGYLYADLRNFNFDIKFDLIIIQETLEHINDNPIRVLKALNNTLSQDGLIIISVPNFFSIKNIIKFFKLRHPYFNVTDLANIDSVEERTGVHWIEFDKNLITKCLHNAGFEIIKMNCVNLSYGNKLNFFIKNVVKFLFPFIFDQPRIIAKKC